MEALDLLKELIKINTVDSRNSEKVVALVSSYLQKEPEIIEQNGIKNAIFIKGKGKNAFVLCGHYDVVPANDFSVDPFSAIEKDGFIYGRGASDMKSGLAMQIEVFRRIKEEEIPEDKAVILIVVGDEEKGGKNGALPSLLYLKEKGYRFFRYLGAEPMFQEKPFSTMKTGRRGILHLTINLKGKAGHAALNLKENPIYQLPYVIEYLQNLKLNDKPDMIPTSVAITNIASNSKAINVTPSLVQITLDIRYNYGNKENEIIDKIKEGLERLSNGITYSIDVKEMPYTIAFKNKDKDYASLVKKITKEIAGIEPEETTVGGSSDARFFACKQLVDNEVGIIEFGPTSYNAHGKDEKVNAKEALLFADIYEKIIINSL